MAGPTMIVEEHIRRLRSYSPFVYIPLQDQGLGMLVDGSYQSETNQLKESISKLRKSFEIEEKNKGTVPVFKKALLYAEKIAIKDARDEYSYLQLYVGAKKLSTQISNICGSGASSHVAHICSKSVLWPITQWACWMSGQVSMPLRDGLSVDVIKIVVQAAKSNLMISTPEYEDTAKNVAEQLDIALIIIDHNFMPKECALHSMLRRLLLTTGDHVLFEGTLNNDFYINSTALLLHTAGTTGTPKGVVVSHKNLTNQINNLTKVWHFTTSDILLHVLPLNHVHGYTNALMAPLSHGAKVVLHDDHNTYNMWNTILGGNVLPKDRANVFMGVPSIYSSLIAEYEQTFAKSPHMIDYVSSFCKTHFRLMVSGSAPLPINIFNRWQEITCHNILEHYDMAETGIVLCNPYFENEGRKRKPGVIGMPLPEVSVRLVSPDNDILLTCRGGMKNERWSQTLSQSASEENAELVGELYVAGPMFQGYLNHPNESEGVFLDDYFKTGDIVAYEKSAFKILGRIGVDIMNSEGHIVSCLEIEALLLTHPHVKEVAVLGVPHHLWQDLIYALCVLQPDKEFDFTSLKSFCAKHLPTYKHPGALKLVNYIPRDEMDKVNKKLLFEIYFVPK